LQVWFIPETNEIFTKYRPFLQKANLYRTPDWSCSYTGHSGLTYLEALEEEKDALQALKKFPSTLEETVCKSVHHSIGKLEEIITKALSDLRDAADTAADNTNNKKSQKEEDTNKASKKSKPVKAPVTKSLLRTYIVKNTTQQGPEYGKSAWVVLPHLASRFHLPTELPNDVKQILEASVKVPKSAQKKKKRYADDEEDEEEEGGYGGGDKEGAAKKKKSKEGDGDGDIEPKKKKKKKEPKPPKEPKLEKPHGPPVTARPLQQVEAQYGEGTMKQGLVEVFKIVQPAGLDVQGILDKAKELGVKVLEGKDKRQLVNALVDDRNFVRLSKGIYTLHCFHPDKVMYSKLPKAKKQKQGRGDGSDGEGENVEGLDKLGRAQRLVKKAKAALSRNKAVMEAATKELEDAKAKLADVKKIKGGSTPAKPVRESIEVPQSKLVQFELTEEQREYKGEPDDRKAMLEHRQTVQALGKELEKKKAKFIEEERDKAEKAYDKQHGDWRAAELAVRKAEEQIDSATKGIEAAEKSLESAEKKLKKEESRVENDVEKDKLKEEREKRRQQKLEEREQRRIEAEAARKYPIEDLELLQDFVLGSSKKKGASSSSAPAVPDVHPPTQKLDKEEGERMGGTLYVADFVSQFTRYLGLRAVSYTDLDGILAQGFAGVAADDNEGTVSSHPLHHLYTRLLTVLLDDIRESGVATALQKRWQSVLSEGTWPEVLRRLVLTAAAEKEEEPHHYPTNAACMAAGMLGFDGAEKLTRDQHLALLCYLCDEVVETDKVRAVLQKREDDVSDAKRDIRGDMAEERKRLRQLMDEEKEEKKRRREEEKAAANDGADANNDNDGKRKKEEEQGKKEENEDPSFELPDHLKEYSGDPDDKKALIQFRQAQQAEKRRLDRERSRWLGDILRAQRAEEARLKEEKDAEKAKVRAREEAEEALALAQEALEEKMERYAVRRLPLGYDRHMRRYWWGLAGHRPAVLVEDSLGTWGIYSTVDDAIKLLKSLDRRGVRELALAQTIERKFEGIEIALRREERVLEKRREEEAAQKEKEALKDRNPPQRQSSRAAKQIEFFKPPAVAVGGGGGGGRQKMSVTTTKLGVTEEQRLEALQDFFSPLDAMSMLQATTTLLELQDAAIDADVPPPANYSSGRWKEWSAAIKAAAKGEAAVGDIDGNKVAQPSAGEFISMIQKRVLELEEALFAVADEPQEDHTEDDIETEEEEEEYDNDDSQGGGGENKGLTRSSSFQVLEYVDDAFSPTKESSESTTRLWLTTRERMMWRADVMQQNPTAARLAYCCAVLGLQAMPMLETKYGKGKSRKGGAGGTKKGKKVK